MRLRLVTQIFCGPVSMRVKYYGGSYRVFFVVVVWSMLWPSFWMVGQELEENPSGGCDDGLCVRVVKLWQNSDRLVEYFWRSVTYSLSPGRFFFIYLMISYSARTLLNKLLSKILERIAGCAPRVLDIFYCCIEWIPLNQIKWIGLFSQDLRYQ